MTSLVIELIQSSGKYKEREFLISLMGHRSVLHQERSRAREDMRGQRIKRQRD